MQRGNEPALPVEERCIHAKLKFKRGTPQKSRHSTVARLFRGIPNGFIARKTTLFLVQLISADFNLLQAKHIQLLSPYPVQRFFPQRRPQTIEVPCDYLHWFRFMVNYVEVK